MDCNFLFNAKDAEVFAESRGGRGSLTPERGFGSGSNDRNLIVTDTVTTKHRNRVGKRMAQL